MKYLVLVLVVVVGVVCGVKPRFTSRFTQQFQRQQIPHAVYGPPPQEYGPPPQEYGPPPQETTTQPQDVTTTEIPTTTEQFSESINATRTRGRLMQGERGVYYIYHPNGQLQKVSYSTKTDKKNKAYVAQLKYENVEPIRAPIFTYDPETQALTRLQQ